MSKTANVSTTDEEGQSNVELKNINALVSEEFRNTVEEKANEQGYNVSTFLAYHIQRGLGMDIEPPEKDREQTKFMLSTQIPKAAKGALDTLIKSRKADKNRPTGDGVVTADTAITVTDFLRAVAAEATGYDLSQEPARAPGGAYIKNIQAKNEELQTGMAKTFARLQALLSREEFEDTMAEAGMTYEKLGLAPIES